MPCVVPVPWQTVSKKIFIGSVLIGMMAAVQVGDDGIRATDLMYMTAVIGSWRNRIYCILVFAAGQNYMQHKRPIGQMERMYMQVPVGS